MICAEKVIYFDAADPDELATDFKKLVKFNCNRASSSNSQP